MSVLCTSSKRVCALINSVVSKPDNTAGQVLASRVRFTFPSEVPAKNRCSVAGHIKDKSVFSWHRIKSRSRNTHNVNFCLPSRTRIRRYKRLWLKTHHSFCKSFSRSKLLVYTLRPWNEKKYEHLVLGHSISITFPLNCQCYVWARIRTRALRVTDSPEVVKNANKEADMILWTKFYLMGVNTW